PPPRCRPSDRRQPAPEPRLTMLQAGPNRSECTRTTPTAPLPPGMPLRHDWTLAEVRALHDLPLLDLLHQAQTVHRKAWTDNAVQLCSLLSVKTGGCPEDCAYCPQAARYQTGVEAERLLPVAEVLEAAGKARAAGATRFCMGAAWREVKDGPPFDAVLEMVRGVKALGMEACC